VAFYDDVRLSVTVERGATGGPGFRTSVLTLSSGFERRNKEWARARGRWNVSYGITTQANLQDVISAFYVVGGRGDGFRFKDWSDFQIGDTISGDATTKQAIGTGNGVIASFQVFKRYPVASRFFDRVINKLVQGTVRVFFDAVEKTETTHYTVNYNTGVITPVSLLGAGIVIYVMCQFDVPVRFDSDELDVRAELFDSAGKISLPPISLIEIRV